MDDKLFMEYLDSDGMEQYKIFYNKLPKNEKILFKKAMQNTFCCNLWVLNYSINELVVEIVKAVDETIENFKKNS